MAVEPVRLLDGLIKGLILTTYDFARLTLAGFLIPFIQNTSRFWPGVLGVSQRLSPITHLALWIVLAVAVALGTGSKLASGLAGLSQTPDTTVVSTIFTALLLVLFVDLSIRASSRVIQNRVKRGFYENLQRIAIANLFLGACVVCAFIPGKAFSLAAATFGSGPTLLIFPHPLLLFFCIPAALVFARALGLAGFKRLGASAAVLLCIPFMLVNVSWRALGMVSAIERLVVAPSDPTITQTLTACRLVLDKIEVTGFLSLKGQEKMVVRPTDFSVSYTNNKEFFEVRVLEDQPSIVLSKSTYVPFKILATRDLKDSAVELVQDNSCNLGLQSRFIPAPDDEVF